MGVVYQHPISRILFGEKQTTMKKRRESAGKIWRVLMGFTTGGMADDKQGHCFQSASHPFL